MTGCNSQCRHRNKTDFSKNLILQHTTSTDLGFNALILEATQWEAVQNSHSIEAAERIIEQELGTGDRALLLWLLDLCLEVVAREAENKMSEKNMAVVGSPNLYDPSAMANPMKAMSVS